MPSAGYIHLAIVYVVWGTVYPVIRIALIDANALTPMQLQTGRLLLSAAVLAIPLMLRARFIIKSRRDLALCIVSGCLFWVTGNGFATLALRQLPAGFVTMAAAGIPVWTAIFQSFFDYRSITRMQVASLAFGFIGMLLVFFPALSSGAQADLYKPFELFVAFSAPITWALGSMLQRSLRRTLAPEAAASMQMAVGGSCWLVLALVDGSPLPDQLSRSEIIAFLYLILFVGALGFSSYIKVARLFPSHIGASFAYVNPVVGLLLAWLFLDERIALMSLVGMTTVIASVIVLLWQTDRSPSHSDGPRELRDH
jgi:drug/metabolite transporter (DMT)-like permease